MKQSIWVASASNVEHYRKFKGHYVLDDIREEIGTYLTFTDIDKSILLRRVFNSVKQSLRVRGINWLFKMRNSLIAYEASIGERIKYLEKELIRNKQLLRDNWPDFGDPNTSKESIIKYYKLREDYLKAKIRLEEFIHHKKNIHLRITPRANDILKEQ